MIDLKDKPERLTKAELAEVLGCKEVSLGAFVVFLEW